MWDTRTKSRAFLLIQLDSGLQQVRFLFLFVFELTFIRVGRLYCALLGINDRTLHEGTRVFTCILDSCVSLFNHVN